MRYVKFAIYIGCKTIGRLSRHTASVHEGYKPYKCEICPSQFFEKYQLGVHTRVVHEGKKPFQCDFDFTSKDSLNKHKREVHEEMKPFKCKIFDTCFARKAHLIVHIKAVTK